MYVRHENYQKEMWFELGMTCGNGAIKKCGFVGVGVVILQEVCHSQGGL